MTSKTPCPRCDRKGTIVLGGYRVACPVCASSHTVLVASREGCGECGRVWGERHHLDCPENMREIDADLKTQEAMPEAVLLLLQYAERCTNTPDTLTEGVRDAYRILSTAKKEEPMTDDPSPDKNQCAKCHEYVTVPRDMEFEIGDYCWECAISTAEAENGRLREALERIKKQCEQVREAPAFPMLAINARLDSIKVIARAALAKATKGGGVA